MVILEFLGWVKHSTKLGCTDPADLAVHHLSCDEQTRQKTQNLPRRLVVSVELRSRVTSRPAGTTVPSAPTQAIRVYSNIGTIVRWEV